MPQKIERGITQEGWHGRSLVGANRGGILAEVDTLGPMFPVLEESVPTQLYEWLCGADLLRQVGDAVAHLSMLRSFPRRVRSSRKTWATLGQSRRARRSAMSIRWLTHPSPSCPAPSGFTVRSLGRTLEQN